MSERNCIRYRDGYRYQLVEMARYETSIKPGKHIRTQFIDLAPDGVLTIRSGYAWDGPSGPAMDTPAAMYGSLAHDALYQLIRERKLAPDMRKAADKDYKRFCLEGGMWKLRAWAHFEALRDFGASSADPANDRPILTAP